MRKAFLFLYLLCTSFIFSQEIGLTEILSIFEEDSIYIKKEKIEIEKFKMKEKGNFTDIWTKITGKIESNGSYAIKTMDYSNLDDEIKNGEIYGELKYRSFFINSYFSQIENTYNIQNYELWKNNKEIKVDKVSVGIQKRLNDFIYSENKYKSRVLNLEKKQLENNLKSKRIEKEIELIEEYIKIKDLEIEIKIKENMKLKNDEILRVAKLKQKSNEKSNLEVELLKVENLKLDEQIKYLKRKVVIKRESFFEKIGIKDNGEIILKDIEKRSIDKLIIDDIKLKNKKIEKKAKKEELRYEKRKSQWPITAGVSYDLKNEIFEANLSFDLEIFSYKVKKNQAKADLEKLDLENIEITKYLNSELEDRKTEYKHLKEEYRINEKMMKITKQRFEYLKEMYLNGDIKALDYIEFSNKTKEAELKYRKSKNKLNGFRFKNIILKNIKKGVSIK